MLLYSALIGQWRYCLTTDKLSATMQIANRVYSLAQKLNDSALMIGGELALAVTLYFVGDFETAREHARRGGQIWHSGKVQSPVGALHSPAVGCLFFEALPDCGFHLIPGDHDALTFRPRERALPVHLEGFGLVQRQLPFF